MRASGGSLLWIQVRPQQMTADLAIRRLFDFQDLKRWGDFPLINRLGCDPDSTGKFCGRTARFHGFKKGFFRCH